MSSLEKLLNPNQYQVFLFTCTASTPFIFAKHAWFVVNKKGRVSRWEVFWRANRSAESWGHLHKDFYPPLQGIEKFFFSDTYFWKDVKLVGVIEGGEDSVAKQMADCIENSPEMYPHCASYALTGPNSNTYVQWILNQFSSSGLRLPWNAFGSSRSRMR